MINQGRVELVAEQRKGEFSIKKLLLVRQEENRGLIYPSIKVSGKWLEHLGWKKGQRYTIQAGENKILIEKDK